MGTNTDKNEKDKKKIRKLRWNLIKTKCKMFCIICTPILISALEVFIDRYRKSNRGDRQ